VFEEQETARAAARPREEAIAYGQREEQIGQEIAARKDTPPSKCACSRLRAWARSAVLQVGSVLSRDHFGRA
jgi:hypothetical protein